MALSFLGVSIFMPSILYLYLHLCVIFAGFVSASKLCPKCHIWRTDTTAQSMKWTHLSTEYMIRNGFLTRFPSCKSLALQTITHWLNSTRLNFLFPSWADLHHRDQQSYLFARQPGTVDPLQSSWLKLRPLRLSIHHSVLGADREKLWTSRIVSCLSYEGQGGDATLTNG